MKDTYSKNRISTHKTSLYNLDKVCLDAIAEALIGIGKDKVVLDFGAGNTPWKGLLDSKEYITIDVNQNENHTIDHIIQPNDLLPLDENSVDVIICLDVLEHHPNPTEALKEFKRVLKINGELIISIPFMYREHEFPYDYQRYTSEGIKNILTISGFSNLKIEKVGNFWYTIISLFFERNIMNGEVPEYTILGKVINKLISFCLPILNTFLFSPKVKKGQGIYHSLIIHAQNKL